MTNNSNHKNEGAKPAARVGAYEIGKTLGHGSFGKVKLAVNQNTKEKVAVKFFKHRKFTTPQQLENCKREIEIMKLLSHPNIVSLIDVVEKQEDGATFLIVEYVAGGELFDYIVANGVVKEKEARQFFRQIVSAVEYCHANLIVHRDLKPENLLLDGDGNIKISDFGLSNVIEPGKLLDSFCGSPLYAAPEILLAERYVGPPVDVWSMGVILYALLCGHLPWCGETQAEISHNSVRGIYEEPEGLSSSVRDLIRKMLNPCPKDRITMEEIRLHPWISEGFNEPPPSLLSIRQPVFEVREEILEQLVSLGYKNIDDCRKRILDNEISQMVAIYHLLLDRIVDEEMTEIKKKLIQKKSQQQSSNHHDPVSKVVNIHSDAMERRLSSPTRAIALAKLAAIPEDESNDLRNSLGSSCGVTRNNRSERRSNQRRGSVAVDGRSILTSSAPIPRPDAEPVRVRNHASSVPSTGVTNAEQTPRWQQRRSSVASGTGDAPLPNFNFNNRRQQQGRKQQNSTHRKANGYVNGYCEGHNDPASRKFSLDSRAITEQISRESGGDPQQQQSVSPKLSSSPPAMLSPRLVKGVFKSSTTTSKSPDETVKTVKNCLEIGDLFVKRTSPYVFQCIDEETGVKFQLEVCKIQQLDLTGVHLKRISGDIWKYKALCNTLVNDMKL